jgi:Na+/melibiose symporter-like transporter
MKHRIQFDHLVVILTILVGVFLIIVAYKAPTPDIPQQMGPHVWPILILTLLIVCAILLFFQTLSERRKSLPSPDPAPTEGDMKWYRKPEVSAVLTILGLVFYGVFLQSLGFIICTSALAVYQARVLERGRWIRNIVSSVLFSVAIYFSFAKLLMVRLPPGLLDW